MVDNMDFSVEFFENWQLAYLTLISLMNFSHLGFVKKRMGEIHVFAKEWKNWKISKVFLLWSMLNNSRFHQYDVGI